MHVIATAGHVDHGKSTLVRALTGTDPDRLAEERRRGLTVTLGYCWTELPGAGEIAFVDVPGHERFLATMLSGVGPVPAALFVVAADDGWMPQAAEHLEALNAFGVENAVLAVTRADLADPTPAADRATAELAQTSLRGAPVVTVSGRTGHGLAELRTTLGVMAASLSQPDPDSDVRLWVDRCFAIRGVGTVVTGTLPAGTIRAGDYLALGDESVRVRGIEALGRPLAAISGVARVALNLGSKVPTTLDRSSVLVTPGAWHHTNQVDVRAPRLHRARMPERMTLHIGGTAENVHVRPLGDELARIQLHRPLPLRIGDRAILRDPGSRQLVGMTVVDPIPPPLDRRGAAARRAADIASADGQVDATAEVQRRRMVQASLLRRIGVDPVSANAVQADDWVISHEHVAQLRHKVADLVREHDRAHPLDPGLPVPAIVRSLSLPAPSLVRHLLDPPMHLSDGRVTAASEVNLPRSLMEALDLLATDLREHPFLAPDAHQLRALGLDDKALAAATRAGHLLRITNSIVLLPGADREAARRLRELQQPFTVGEARQCLGTTRRVALPLLEHLDRLGHTRRLPDNRRQSTRLPDPPIS